MTRGIWTLQDHHHPPMQPDIKVLRPAPASLIRSQSRRDFSIRTAKDMILPSRPRRTAPGFRMGNPSRVVQIRDIVVPLGAQASLPRCCTVLRSERVLSVFSSVCPGARNTSVFPVPIMTLIQDSVLDEAQSGLVGGRMMWILSNFPPSLFFSFDYYNLWFLLFLPTGSWQGTVRLIMLFLLGSRTPRRIYLMRDVQIQQ